MKPCQALPPGAAITDGLWEQVIHYPQGKDSRPALFLDRDGAVLVEAHYLQRTEDVALIPGAVAVIRRANTLGVPTILVTNQAGIGYGYFGWDAFIGVQECFLDMLAAEDVRLDGVFACPFHVKGEPPYQHPDHPARKPNPGMLLRARDLLNIDLEKSWIIGDRQADLLAGKNAGLAGGQHVLTGHGGREGEQAAALALNDDTFSALASDSIAEALDLIPILRIDKLQPGN